MTENATLKKWKCLDSATGEALAEAVRNYHLPDFRYRRWVGADPARENARPTNLDHRPTPQDSTAFARLEKDWRTSTS